MWCESCPFIHADSDKCACPISGLISPSNHPTLSWKKLFSVYRPSVSSIKTWAQSSVCSGLWEGFLLKEHYTCLLFLFLDGQNTVSSWKKCIADKNLCREGAPQLIGKMQRWIGLFFWEWIVEDRLWICMNLHVILHVKIVCNRRRSLNLPWNSCAPFMFTFCRQCIYFTSIKVVLFEMISFWK